MGNTPSTKMTNNGNIIETLRTGVIQDYIIRGLDWDFEAIQRDYPDFQGGYTEEFGCNSQYILGLRWDRNDANGNLTPSSPPANPNLYYTSGCANWD